MKNISLTEKKESSSIVEIGVQRRVDDPNPIYPVENQAWINSSKTTLDLKFGSLDITKDSRLNTFSPFGTAQSFSTDVIRLDNSQMWTASVSGVLAPKFYKKQVPSIVPAHVCDSTVISSAGNAFASYRVTGGVAPFGIILKKYKFDGEEISTFSTNLGTITVPSAAVTCLAISDTHVFIASSILMTLTGNISGAVSSSYIYKIDMDGQADISFVTNLGTGFNGGILCMMLDGTSLVVGGSFTSVKSTPINRLVKISLADPAATFIDTAFSTAIGTGANGDVNCIVKTSTSDYVIGGAFTSFNTVVVGTARVRIAKMSSAGALDTSFSSNIGATSFNSTVREIIQLKDSSNNLICTGDFTAFRGVTTNRIARIQLSGLSDRSDYSIGSGFNAVVNSLAIDSSLKILSGGDFTTYQGVSQNRLIKLNADGTKDATFNVGTGFNAAVNTVSTSSSGTYVGGTFTTYNSLAQNGLVRLNATTAAKDAAFDVGAGFIGSVLASAVDSSNRVLVGGAFSSYKGVTENRILRLQSNGTKDSSFVTGTGFDSSVNSIAIQSDNKILIGGDFTTYKGLTQNRLIRLDVDGSKDASLDIGTGFSGGDIRAVLVQSDDKIYVGGNFTSFNGSNINRLVRLNTNGSIDTSFNIGSGFNGAVNSVAISNQTLVVSGNFTTFNGGTQNRIVALDLSGSAISTYSLGTGFDAETKSVVSYSTDSVFIGGNFTTYKAVSNNRLLKLDTSANLGSRFASFNLATAGGLAGNGLSLEVDDKNIYVGTTDAAKPLYTYNYHGESQTNLYAPFVGTNVRDLKIKDHILYACGDFTSYKASTDEKNFVAIHRKTGNINLLPSNFSNQRMGYILFKNESLAIATLNFSDQYSKTVSNSLVLEAGEGLLIKFSTIDGVLTLNQVAVFEAAPFPSGKLGALNILSGETFNIAAGGVYDYSSINIAANGTLNIDGTISPELTEIYCNGPFTLNGTIRGRRQGNGGFFEKTTAVGETINFTVTQKLGGSGLPGYAAGAGGSGINGFGGGGGGSLGQGGQYGGPGGSGGSPGTNGNPDTRTSGGLGGAGNFTLGAGGINLPNNGGRNGGRGGEGGGSGGGGGAGGEYNKYSSDRAPGNGGAGGGYKGQHGIGVYLYIKGAVSGNGVIDLTGTNGFVGGNTTNYGGYVYYGGPGGGGAGGSGGSLIARDVGNSFNNKASTSFNPTKIWVKITGGSGGTGGSGSAGTAGAGEPGDNGIYSVSGI
jgi:uncharacterized delta-60 repeat protein